jgi:hypothetical protein
MSFYSDLARDVASIRGETYGCLGLRPYRVFAVLAGWTGPEVGRGTRQILSRTELGCGKACDGAVAPPSLVLAGSWSRAMHGVVEEGTAMLEGLDPTYAESFLAPYASLAPGQESWIEVRQDGGAAVRRFTITGVPFLDAKRFGWVLRLSTQEPSGPFAGEQLDDQGDVTP